jgi:hypothetical protein
LRPAQLFALAVAANLLVAGGVAAAVAPVETSGTALSWYDALPQWARGLLGDQQDQNGETNRGWLGDWLAGFHANALRGDPKAQLKMDPRLESEEATGTWTSASEARLSWTEFGATLTYHVSVTDSQEAPDVRQTAVDSTTATNLSVPLEPGENWVHVQASHRERTGPVWTLGPFLSDPEPPTAPPWVQVDDQAPADSRVFVESYHFTLEWGGAEARSGITAYHLERQNGGAGWTRIATLDSENTTHPERNRPNGVHTYRVIAESGSGLESAPGPVLRVHVDAQGSLSPPGTGQWHYGINAVYDSVIHVWDISDPSLYTTIDEIHAGQAGLTQQEVQLYTGGGWGIELDDPGLQQAVASVVGDETNALTIGLDLFEWMFDQVDYDFEKFQSNDPEEQRLLTATETLERGGGICGDLTALYVTLLRIAGVPARPVHGYLINQGGTPDQDFETIGGFHMWPEIYVGGDAINSPGGGWIPVDVSGMTGSFDKDKLHFYFGVSNPNYLQLGVQRDLTEEGWNVWANLGYSFRGSQPTVNFQADAYLMETEYEQGAIWFTPGGLERVFCEDDENTEDCRGSHTRGFPVKARSVRMIDYGAELSWSGDVHELTLSILYPAEPSPTQVMMWTAYHRDATCAVHESQPSQSNGFLRWTIPGGQQPCSQ